MFEVTKQEALTCILDYLKEDQPNCLYLYADLAVYGLRNPNIQIWYDQDGQGIRMVVMKYHKNFQIYTNRAYENINGVLKLIEQEMPFGISGRKEIITSLEDHLKDLYHAEYGVVFRGKTPDVDKLKRRMADCTVDVEVAQEKDAPAIAHLLCMDEELGSSYTEASLTEELSERIRTGMGRNFIIRKGERIVAHNATYAECNNFAIDGGLMVHPDFRNTEYANWITIKSNLILLEEGKKQYFFVTKRKIIRWHTISGAEQVAEYGKLSLIEKAAEMEM